MATCKSGQRRPCPFLALLVALGAALVVWGSLRLAAHAIGRVQAEEFERHGRARVQLVHAFGQACRNYCADYLRPALQEKGVDFVIEGMSATFLAERVFDYLRREFPGFHYRQAARNPLNRKHLPTKYEEQLIRRFEADPSLSQLTGILRDEQVGKVYYVARPIYVERRCLQCHGDPKDVPAEIRARYGTESGYHWQPGQLAGILMISVPMQDVLASQARVRDAVYQITTLVSCVLGGGIAICVLLLLRWNCRLREARQRAEAASEAKSRFLATMSHEMRTPLTAIAGYADELALVDRQHGLPAEAKDAVQAIRTSSKHLLALINDILDLARIEAGREERHVAPVRLGAVLADVLSIMAVRAAEKGLALKVRVDGRVPEIVDADAAQLRQILVNLVGNAIKFTPSGSVTIRLAAEPRGSRQCLLTIAVEDTGVGIPPDRLEELFEPFVQCGNADQRRQGSGLGLAVTRRLVEMAGGTIRAESTVGQGSVFTVTLPVRHAPNVRWVGEDLLKQAVRENDKEYDEDVRLDGIRVLLCEDNALNARLIERILQRAGAECETLRDGAAAVEYFQRLPRERWPHVVLMDLQMPVMDGLTATVRLREQGVDVPIVALTANVLKEDRDRCLQNGFTDYLSKPIERGALLRLLERYGRQRTAAAATEE